MFHEPTGEEGTWPALYLEAEAAIREEEDRIMRGRGQKDGEEENKKMTEPRRRVLERGEKADDGEEELRTQTETEERRGGATRPKTPLSFRRWHSEVLPSPKVLQRGKVGMVAGLTSMVVGFLCGAAIPLAAAAGTSLATVAGGSGVVAGLTRFLFYKVLQRVKVVVAAGLTGFLVGALCGAAVPLAAAAGASLVGKAASLTAAQLVARALIGGFVGGSVGAVAGLQAASPEEGVQIALGQVGLIGVSAVGLVSLWELWLS
ncbi:hypothetical protein NHX12_031203 [Muraenolepis orangiensis]|uniref:Uncharacterized protein n=1 Tax=Muraenolepis orangiensis TaxID=630683 RepID=A0A9Q0E3M3_9TELE|nr:hypothetical protein NHX12_031203 [Muraenolepis orangiensis]